jgi:uncharacterized protein (TIGR02996 family)
MAATKARAKTGRDPLADALAAVKANRVAGALAPLLAAWRTQPSDRLSEVIEMVSLRTRTPAPVRGKTAAAIAAWDEAAAKAGPHDLPGLLETLADVRSGEAAKRLAVIAGHMPDPRVDAALVDLVHAVPYRATATKPFWTELFALASNITDARALVRLDTANADGVAATMASWLRTRIATLREDTAWKRKATSAASPVLDEIADLLGPRKASIGTLNLDALLHAIHDAPGDDAPRLVYADALLERGNPRGEFIALQIRKPGDREARRREKELLDQHGKQWLGELAPVIMAGYVFERGFLAECRIDNRHLDRVKKLVGHPGWATVRSIEGSALIALHPSMKALRELSFRSWEARNHEQLPDSWRDLLIGTERPIEKLRYAGIESDRHWEDALEANQSVRPGQSGRWVHVPAVMELEALCTCSALPKLRELIVVEHPDLVADRLFASPVAKRLATLGFVYNTRNERRPPLQPFATALREAAIPALHFEIGPDYHTTIVDLERGARGYERVAITVGPTTRSTWSEQLVNEAIGILDALAVTGTLREARITTRKQTDPNQVARLRSAAAQMKLDVCDVG